MHLNLSSLNQRAVHSLTSPFGICAIRKRYKTESLHAIKTKTRFMQSKTKTRSMQSDRQVQSRRRYRRHAQSQEQFSLFFVKFRLSFLFEVNARPVKLGPL